MHTDERTEWDYVVVGGGSAGCAVAHRLAENGRDRVLLLEAGTRDWHPTLHVPGLLMQGLRRPSVTWSYTGEPDPTCDNRQTAWRAGRALGGGSAVNGLVWVWGHRADFDRWAELGCTGWDAANVETYFRRLERFTPPVPNRGRSGPVVATRVRVTHPMTDAFVESAIASGYPFTDDYNGEYREGVGYGQSNTHRGFRSSTATAYLPATRRRPNLAVFTGATARRVLFEGTRATGVVFDRGGTSAVALAKREIVLSAGALWSPKLLMLSGVGPAAHLKEHGIDVVADSPGVGANLQDHQVIAMRWYVDIPTFNTVMTPVGVAREGMRFALAGRGPAAAGFFHAIAFTKVNPDAQWTEIEMGFSPLGVGGHDDASEHDVSQNRLMDRPAVTVSMSLLHPRGRGHVALRSSDPSEPPSLRFDIFSDPGDLRDMIAGVRQLRGIFSAEPMRAHIQQELTPGPSVESDAEWEAYLRATAWVAQHPAGTCAMGVGPDAVLDPALRVRGVEHLRVADASVMPVITSGNTNAPAIMIGEKAADLIKDDAR